MSIKCEKCGKELPSERGLKAHLAWCGKARKREKKAEAPKAEVTKAEVQPEVEETKAEFQPQAVVEPEFALAPPVFNTTPTEIPVGTRIRIHGENGNPQTIWQKLPTSAKWATAPVSDLTVTVVSREPVQEGIWLICRADGSEVLWGLREPDVLHGKRYAIEDMPVPAAPPAELEESEAEKAAKLKAHEDFQASLANYIEANDAKLAALRVYKQVDKAERPIIWAYVEEHGEETIKDRGDYALEALDHVVHLEKTPGGYDVRYEKDAIADWLVKNNHLDCIKMVPDMDKWKALKEAGGVPAQIIAAVETPVAYEDTFALKIRPAKNLKNSEE